MQLPFLFFLLSLLVILSFINDRPQEFSIWFFLDIFPAVTRAHRNAQIVRVSIINKECCGLVVGRRHRIGIRKKRLNGEKDSRNT
eukprot:XP_001705168.1 Hypothetical protein GL50803_39003 [Giardia lamblia ATCC 50803]